MKHLLIVLPLLIGSAWADTVIRCRQLPGALYPNSAKNIQSINLISYVNHFSLTNMMAMRIDTDTGEHYFGRQSIEVTNTTNIKMIQRTTNPRFMHAWLLIDRTPRSAMTTRAFRGVLFVSDPTDRNVKIPTEILRGSITTHNFECSI